MKKYWIRIIKTIILAVIAFACYYFPKEIEIKETITQKPLVEITRNTNGIVELLHYIGLFCLVFLVWLWRDILKINQIGIIGGPEPTPSKPDDVSKSLVDSNEHKEVEILKVTDFKNSKIIEQKNAILQVMDENDAKLTNVNILSTKLRLSKNKVEELLFELQKEGKVRKDIFPGSLYANYSRKDSFVNWAIDKYIESSIKKYENVLSDVRYFRILNKYDIDAIIETQSTTCIVEVKSISKYIDSKVIEKGIKQLLTIEEGYKASKPLKLVLIFVIHKDFDNEIDGLKTDFFDIKDNLKIEYYRYK